MDKIAIIGTSVSQRDLFLKAKAANYYTIGFSWDESPDMINFIDHFYRISIMEKDSIVDICRKEAVCGVVSNGSELTARVSSYVAEQLGLSCTKYETIINMQNKKWVRDTTCNVRGLSQLKCHVYNADYVCDFPCVVKPFTGCGKKGVSYVSNPQQLKEAINYVHKTIGNDKILIEEYIEGVEVSVETISFNGKHYVIQITDKDSSGPPHFVELGHHQPSMIAKDKKDAIYDIMPNLLDKVGFTNGATHTELKINDKGIYLIEVNPRGGGDFISTKLVELSTGYDYILSMIQVAMGRFSYIPVNRHVHSGIYFLTKETGYMLSSFLTAKQQPWYVEGELYSTQLHESLGNATKDGYVIYQSDHKIVLN